MKRIAGAALVALAATCSSTGVPAAGGSMGGARTNDSASTLTARAAGGCGNANLRPNRTNVTAVATAIVCLVNRERMGRRVGPLRPNAALSAVAAKQARDMVAGGYFGDNSPSGQTPLRRVVASRYASGGHGVALGQNIGWAVGVWATPAAMVRSWMASAPHRAILLKAAYRDVGAGIVAVAPQRRWRHRPGATYVLELAARST